MSAIIPSNNSLQAPVNALVTKKAAFQEKDGIVYLPKDVLYLIFSKLDCTSILNLEKTCVDFYLAINNDTCFSRVLFFKAISRKNWDLDHSTMWKIASKAFRNEQFQNTVQTLLRSIFDPVSQNTISLAKATHARVQQLNGNVDCNGYFPFIMTIQKLLTSAVEKSKNQSMDESQIAKINENLFAVLVTTRGESFDVCIGIFASKALSEITIDSFNKEAHALQKIYQQIPEDRIVNELCKGIALKHKTELDKICDKSASPEAYNSMVARLKKNLKEALTAQKKELEGELNSLLSSDGIDGAIKIALQRKTQAEFAYSKGCIDLENLLKLAPERLVSRNFADIMYFLLNIYPKGDEGRKWIDSLRQQIDELSDAQNSFTKLVLRRDEIVRYKPGTNTIIGGELATVNAELQDSALTETATAEADRNYSFYNELRQNISNENKSARRKRLKAITGGYTPKKLKFE